MQAVAMQRVFDYAMKMKKEQHVIVTAWANSGNWLAGSWKPITMLGVLVLALVGGVLGWFSCTH
jgi:hypothetical protein